MKLVQLLSVIQPTPIVDLSSGQATELQTALQQLGYDIAEIDGIVGANTKAAWAAFKQDTGEEDPNVIGPGSIEALQSRLSVGLLPSGPAWVKRFPSSDSVDDLSQPFKNGVIAFLNALRSANVVVTVTATLRPVQRAYLMHWAQQIALGNISAANVPRRPDVQIQWVHTTNAGSVAAAHSMVDAYGIQGPVALDSRHIDGLAIDMFLSWSGTPTVADAQGNRKTLKGAAGAFNTDVVAVGKTYGVVRGLNIPNDPEHWSIDGH
jgi:peptidoglycan hydrolase-like protein with peptidoglycan-binding domain